MAFSSSLVTCLGHLALTTWLGVNIWQTAALRVRLPPRHSLVETPLEVHYAAEFMPKLEQEWPVAKDKISEIVHI